MLKSRNDFLVCGSGPAGSVVGGRLAENAKVRALLLKVGGNDSAPNVDDAVTSRSCTSWTRTACLSGRPGQLIRLARIAQRGGLRTRGDHAGCLPKQPKVSTLDHHTTTTKRIITVRGITRWHALDMGVDTGPIPPGQRDASPRSCSAFSKK